jgi:hypothetical protein
MSNQEEIDRKSWANKVNRAEFFYKGWSRLQDKDYLTYRHPDPYHPDTPSVARIKRGYAEALDTLRLARKEQEQFEVMFSMELQELEYQHKEKLQLPKTPKTDGAFQTGSASGKFMCHLLEMEADMLRKGIETWLERMSQYTDKQYGKGELRALLTTPVLKYEEKAN